MKKLKDEMQYMEQSKIREFNDITKNLGVELTLTLGEPDFDTPAEIKNACIEALNNNMTKYGPTYGQLDLREAICEFENRINNVNYLPSEVLITVGSTEAITTCLFSILNKGDEVIVPIPGYPMYKQIILFSQGVYVPIDTCQSNFQITKEMLNKAISKKTKAIILTSPNNPTGSILSDESLDIIHEAVKDKGIYVICDNCYDQLVYGKRRLGFSKFQDMREKIVVCQSFSKPYAMPGWRIGYMLSDKSITADFAKVHQYMVVAQNTFIQPAAIKALQFDPKPFVDAYRKRRDYIYERITKMGLEMNLPEGAFYAFPSIKKFNMTSFDFCYRFAKEYKVAIIPGSCFEADDYIRISYCVSDDVIEKALDRLNLYIEELKREI